MKNTRVLIVTDYAAPYEGNFIESLKELEKKMYEQGNELIYLFPQKAKGKGSLIELKNGKHKLYYGSDDVKQNIKIIRKIIKDEKISVIYTHFCSLKSQIQVKLIRLLNRKTRLICHFHNHYKLEGKFPRKPLGYFANKGDLNIGCSKSVAESIPYKKDIVTYVDNAINFKRLDNYRDIQIKELENKFVILMFGFDYYRKGVDIAIKAIKDCNKKDIVLAISLSTNREKVEQYIINDFGEIPEFVKFLEPISDIKTYYKNAKIFLTSSREEGLCYSVIEAVYCKTNIIGSNIPGIPKGIPGEYIFENENYSELKDRIIEIYNNNENDKKEEAYEYVKKRYSIDRWVEETNNLLLKVNEQI